MANDVATRQLTNAERFAANVEHQYVSNVGSLNVTEAEKTLIQHMFIKCDMAFKEMNANSPDGKTSVNWQNVNIQKLALDSVHRVRLGLDALIPGHVYPIAYFNNKTKQYDIDLRIGYKGEIYYAYQTSLNPIREIRCELVYSNDEFKVYKKGASCKIDGYDLIIKDPFNRGELVGGYAYIDYVDERQNKLIVLGKKDFDKARDAGKSNKFWGPYYDEMAKKTLVHRAMKEIVIDPKKINAVESMNAVEAEPELADDYADANSVELVMAPELVKEIEEAVQEEPEQDYQEPTPPVVEKKKAKEPVQPTFDNFQKDGIRRPDF